MLCAKSISTFQFWTFPYIRFESFPRASFVPIVMDLTLGEGKNLLVDSFPPTSSSKDNYGDRECSHVKFSGTFSLFDERVVFEEILKATTQWWWVDPTTRMPVYNEWLHGYVRDSEGAGYEFAGMLIQWGENKTQTTPDWDWYRGGQLMSNIHWDATWSSTELVLSMSYDYNGEPCYWESRYSIGPNHTLDYPSYNWKPVCHHGTSEVAVGDPVRFNKLVQGRFSQVRNYFPKESPYIWGDLTQVAVDDAKELNVNSSMYVYDLLRLKKTVTDTISLLKGRANAKNISKLFLTWRYGFTLTYSDTVKVVDAIRRQFEESEARGYSVVRSVNRVVQTIDRPLLSGTVVDRKYNLKIYYDPVDTGWKNWCRKLFDWDFFPSLENVWDFIPFSFVLDWFVKVQDGLSYVDTKTYTSLLTVYKVLKGSKTTVTEIPGDYLFQDYPGCTVLGTGSAIFYDRLNQDHLDLPIPRFDTAHSFRNYAELTAILFVKKR